jgi:hypothetical protein
VILGQNDPDALHVGHPILIMSTDTLLLRDGICKVSNYAFSHEIKHLPMAGVFSPNDSRSISDAPKSIVFYAIERGLDSL